MVCVVLFSRICSEHQTEALLLCVLLLRNMLQHMRIYVATLYITEYYQGEGVPRTRLKTYVVIEQVLENME